MGRFENCALNIKTGRLKNKFIIITNKMLSFIVSINLRND